jgi:hypothetical protein
VAVAVLHVAVAVAVARATADVRHASSGTCSGCGSGGSCGRAAYSSALGSRRCGMPLPLPLKPLPLPLPRRSDRGCGRTGSRAVGCRLWQWQVAVAGGSGTSVAVAQVWQKCQKVIIAKVSKNGSGKSVKKWLWQSFKSVKKW